MFVHAHPDDEVTATGVTMAYYAAAGARVTLVTCTRGEEGEVVVDDLAHHAAARDNTLGELREKERATAMAALGVTDFRWLGAPGEYRDSGMAGEATNDVPTAFWQVPVDAAAARLAAIIREVCPTVVVTYDPQGSYGHPDHIQAHRVAMRAVELAADSAADVEGPPWQVAKVYWTVTSASEMREGIRAMREAGESGFDDWDPDGELPPMAVPDDEIAAVIQASEFVTNKIAGWRAYVSQVPADSPMLRWADQPGSRQFWAAESYKLVAGVAAPDPDDPSGRESDLFAGVATAD